MARNCDALILFGPPGSGKSYLGHHLDQEGIAEYRELEPILREKFGSGAAFEERIDEAGRFLWRSYTEQLARGSRPVAIESAGVSDQKLLDALRERFSLLWVRVQTDPGLCVERLLSRPRDRNISSSDDQELLARFLARWDAEIAPRQHFDLCVDGTNSVSAIAAIRSLLAGPR